MYEVNLSTHVGYFNKLRPVFRITWFHFYKIKLGHANFASLVENQAMALTDEGSGLLVYCNTYGGEKN
jgi:hypothetical protein